MLFITPIQNSWITPLNYREQLMNTRIKMSFDTVVVNFYAKLYVRLDVFKILIYVITSQQKKTKI